LNHSYSKKLVHINEYTDAAIDPAERNIIYYTIISRPLPHNDALIQANIEVALTL
jgi:hypothetical protein